MWCGRSDGSTQACWSAGAPKRKAAVPHGRSVQTRGLGTACRTDSSGTRAPSTIKICHLYMRDISPLTRSKNKPKLQRKITANFIWLYDLTLVEATRIGEAANTCLFYQSRHGWMRAVMTCGTSVQNWIKVVGKLTSSFLLDTTT